jgi:transposase
VVKCNADRVERLQRALRREDNPKTRQRIQMVFLRESGMTQPEIAKATSVSLSTVNRAHMVYDNGGRAALEPKPRGGRIRENMTLAGEKALLDRFAKAAGAGEMLNINDPKTAYEEQIGHPTSDSTIYNLLSRHDWRKLKPRPYHADRDLEAQKAIKNRASSRRSGRPNAPLTKRASAAGHVCRRGSFRPDQPSSAVLGSSRCEAGGRLAAHSPIDLPVSSREPQGRGMRVPDLAVR